MHEAHFRGGCAVVTGAGSGLGEAMALRFAAAGAAVVALDIDVERANATAQRIKADGHRAMALQLDVADPCALAAAADAVREFGGCSVLCANAGVQQFGAIDKLTAQDWRWVLDVNLLGLINTVTTFLPLLRDSEYSRHIVVTSSSVVHTPGIRMAAYTTSKYAVTGFAETLRMELAPENIGVSILFPSGMVTRHLESSALARPEALGKSELRREDIDAMMASRDMDQGSHVATAEYATRHLLRDVAANERYILTHDDYRATLEDNFAELLEAHARAQED
ncbi:SDR family oxidoreductase [Mangrovimicrobium sediminis]|uniref:SDR family oxidoreductase n=1 Tax=Mangrovimicrobium sediminis TaxID=2562682 RepID=A0A4Z0LZR6_9GAMM|nr:SDR family oxidoreductase [Haliea sp. SAOS-164]TGD72710.1 SDR family oxidoreductase [Haliea sp. SAOS-164]